ncbi:cytochrome c biogenesis protein ResB [Savagea sp. SN6]|uniref:Cytochrome c biogenesis protein ResB n=1 Tax=Savagea serpentis TaxID=2785297 RepID=A0A8J7KRZ9_9BACL|nr:cytochrome c biogenesis protein ResB [Savagea serpentis]MBF4500049.1 cytochrome c biogenesis protein ResB [Savagea serpentis]
MGNTIKCQCGHVNPEGTELCEACGRPLSEEAKERKIADMRYEGAARRSKTHNMSIIDKTWNFFSSVKVGVWIIIILLVTSAIGTLLPQKMYVAAQTEEEVAAYYELHYGVVGKVYHMLGFNDMYSSWWFKILVGMLGVSIIIASVDRVVPLYKSLKKQRTRRHPSFMKRQRIYGVGKVDHPEQSVEQSAEQFKKLKYNVKLEDGAMLAEKGRFSRWGPYVNHTGLIIFLAGILLRGLPGFYIDEEMWIREGERKAIPSAPGYYIESEGFTMEYYSKEEADEVFGEALDKAGMIAKNYQTDAILYKDKDGALPGTTELEEVKRHPIIVNEPLTYDGYSIFQMDYRLDELYSMTFSLNEKATGESLGQMTIQLDNPAPSYDLGNGVKVEILDYYSDYAGIKDGEPQNLSPVPNNPAFIFKMTTPETPKGETSFVAIRQTLETEENLYEMKFVAADTRDISGLVIRKDKTLWILLIGGIIFMIGVAQGSYWQHRRVWICTGDEGELILAGHTNKNWFGLMKEIDAVKEHVQLPPYEDREDIEKEEKERLKEQKGENE